MINAVELKKLRVVADESGRVAEILRSDEDLFAQFGQVQMLAVYPGVVKAWHYHRIQTDNMAVVKGMMKLALYDGRAASPTNGEVNDFVVGEHNPLLIQVPPGVFHGFKCIGESEAILINLPTHLYNYKDPDVFAVPAHQNDIPYNWAREDGRDFDL